MFCEYRLFRVKSINKSFAGWSSDETIKHIFLVFKNPMEHPVIYIIYIYNEVVKIKFRQMFRCQIELVFVAQQIQRTKLLTTIETNNVDY